MRYTLFYHSYCSWEYDYITKDLLAGVDMDIVNITTEQIYQSSDRFFESYEGPAILVVSSNHIPFEPLKALVSKLKPAILIHLSDEFGDRKECVEFAKDAKILLRQHWFPHYHMDSIDNVFQIPLGYMTGMFDGRPALDIPKVPLFEREYIWSFVGLIRPNRQRMIDVFRDTFPDRHFIGNGLSSKEMSLIYQNTIFVVNDRGQSSLDCFRIYEAIFTGAISVMVSSKEEFEGSFWYRGDIPPLLYADSWDTVAEKCKELLERPEELVLLQKAQYAWLRGYMERIRSRCFEP
jgi:hypothetical protein